MYIASPNTLHGRDNRAVNIPEQMTLFNLFPSIYWVCSVIWHHLTTDAPCIRFNKYHRLQFPPWILKWSQATPMDEMDHICPAHMDLYHAAQPRVGKWGTADASTQHYTWSVLPQDLPRWARWDTIALRLQITWRTAWHLAQAILSCTTIPG